MSLSQNNKNNLYFMSRDENQLRTSYTRFNFEGYSGTLSAAQ